MLCQLLYTSDISGLGTWTMPNLLIQTRARNAASGVSGVLLMNHRHIVQCLEGPTEAVCATFERIAPDPRHTNVTPLSIGPITQRDFPDWSMGFVGLDQARGGPLGSLLPPQGFVPRSMTVDQLRHLMIGARHVACTAA